MNKKQKIYLLISVVVVISSLLLNLLYRPYIYGNNLNDFGLADTIGSLASVVAFCCFVWSWKSYSNKEMNFQIVIATITYSIIWEAFGYYGIYGTYDVKDVVAVIISCVITYILKEVIEQKIQVSQ